MERQQLQSPGVFTFLMRSQVEDEQMTENVVQIISWEPRAEKLELEGDDCSWGPGQEGWGLVSESWHREACDSLARVPALRCAGGGLLVWEAMTDKA